MPFALELFFDSGTEREVRSAWHSLATVSGSSYLGRNGVRPHVALAVVEAASETAFHNWRKLLSAADAPLALEDDGRGSFPAGISFVRFRRTPMLMALHRRVMDFCDRASLQVDPHYRTDTWVPHCTLAQNIPAERMLEVDSASNKLRFSCPWTIASVGIVCFPPSVVVDEEKIATDKPLQPTAPNTLVDRKRHP